MKYIDINRKFTETVSSYIAQGYINEDFLLDHHRISLTSGGYDVVVDHNELRSTTVSTVVGSP